MLKSNFSLTINYFTMKKPKTVRHIQRCIVFVVCIFCTAFLMAQSIKISGTVVDENSEPVFGANVSVKGTTTGTIAGGKRGIYPGGTG